MGIHGERLKARGVGSRSRFNEFTAADRTTARIDGGAPIYLASPIVIPALAKNLPIHHARFF